MAFTLIGNKVACKLRSAIYFFRHYLTRLSVTYFEFPERHISNLLFIMLPLSEGVIFAEDLRKIPEVW